MNLIYKFLSWLGSYVEKPPMFGIYHILWLIGLVIACVIYGLISKKHNNDKFFKNTLFICWIILVLLELLKIIVVGFSIDIDGNAHYVYDFKYFSFQLCSLPFYVLPFIIFLKNEKIKEYLITSMISFILLGGALFALIPGGFKNTLYINFHTMAHHCLQVFSSIVCIFWYKDKMTFKKSLKCILPIGIGMTLAIILNIVIYKLTNVEVQLWNLSPYGVFEMELLENIRNVIGYVFYVLLYFIVLTILSIIVYLIPVLIKRINKKTTNN